MKPEELLTLAAQAEAAIRTYSIRISSNRFANPDPERLKVVSRIASRLRDMQRMLTNAPAIPPIDSALIESIAVLIRQIPATESLARLDSDSAWELSDSLNQELLRIADDAYLTARLNGELKRDEKGDPFSWSCLFPAEKLKEFIKALEAGPTATAVSIRDTVVRWLTLLYDQRASGGRSQRMLAIMRSRYLGRLTVILAILVVLLSISASIIYGCACGPNPDWKCFLGKLIATITAGALGSILAGVYKLRDAPLNIRELRGFDWQFLAMPALGATAALILFVFLMSGLIQIMDKKPAELTWAHLATMGFLAGYSEPFFLGAINRISRNIEERQPKPVAAAKNPEKKEEEESTR
jgi:hypothetical protein